jgi:hypothetical protein
MELGGQLLIVFVTHENLRKLFFMAVGKAATRAKQISVCQGGHDEPGQ